ncbi:MAG: HAMP domain-containing protein [Rhodospirillales bacterium]|nr:HAMP domain-containing protein [Rhodospirillales bacterium]
MRGDDDDDDDDDDRYRRFKRHWDDVDVILVSLPLQDGSWLNVAAPQPRHRPFGGPPFIGGFFFLTVIILLLTVWAVRRSARPLGKFTRAAEQLGLDVNAPPMDEHGPREVRRAAASFNQMQRRIRRFINDRTQMLAAISHDLRTPITRLRLRAEFVEDEEQRNKMLADLEQMEEMIAATLAFARDDAASEARQPVDLAVLLQGLCDDATDAGKEASYQGPDRQAFNGRPVGLRRLFGNLIDNAVKYGSRAAVTLNAEAEALTVTVDDDGPGIAEHLQEKVFSPFTRIEGSRSRETGGVGLGLAVVRSIARAHGGEASLENRPEGGLRVRVTLPVSA